MNGAVFLKDTFRSGVRKTLEDHFLEDLCWVFCSCQAVVLLLEVDPLRIKQAEFAVLVLGVWEPLHLVDEFGDDSIGIVELAFQYIEAGFVLSGRVDKILN